uniref:Uncharacterized protein n=1 Tax=Arundo donax TaxID=35708 RepID=A0A0A9EHF1_ARUDO
MQILSIRNVQVMNSCPCLSKVLN